MLQSGLGTNYFRFVVLMGTVPMKTWTQRKPDGHINSLNGGEEQCWQSCFCTVVVDYNESKCLSLFSNLISHSLFWWVAHLTLKLVVSLTDSWQRLVVDFHDKRAFVCHSFPVTRWEAKIHSNIQWTQHSFPGIFSFWAFPVIKIAPPLKSTHFWRIFMSIYIYRYIYTVGVTPPE